jgi:hypothetical protein
MGHLLLHQCHLVTLNTIVAIQAAGFHIDTHTHTHTHNVPYVRMCLFNIIIITINAHVQVATVDKFQGQQNDFILLSLVRSRFVGHLRDVRRLVVAMSRARLGLYVFCRRSLFEQCYELQPTFQHLLQRPDRLALNFGEVSTYTERQVEDIGHPYFVSSVEEMGHIVMDKMNQLHQVYSSLLHIPFASCFMVDSSIH